MTYSSDSLNLKHSHIYSIDTLLSTCHRCHNKEKQKLIKQAYKFLTNNLSDQQIINHSIEVAQVVGGEIGLGATSVTAAILHELPRYSDITLEDIRTTFGKEIFQILEGLYKIKNTELQFKQKDIENIDLYRQVIFNMSRDLRIIYLRIAERLVTLRHFDDLSITQKNVIPSETLKIYAPIADALGSFKIKSELEDRSFKYLNPEKYKEISQYIEHNKIRQWYILNKVALPIIKTLLDNGLKFTMQSRQKSIYSIYQKMVRKNIDIKQIYDIFAIRIILHSDPKLDKDQRIEQEKVLCQKTFEIIKSLFEIHPNRVRDWLNTPKQPSGYMAKHVTVRDPHSKKWIEIQIRGQAMNEIAEFGYAAHWKYKGVKLELEQFSRQLKQITQYLENFDQDIESILSAIEPLFRLDKIHVYTPDLDEIILNHGATVLDFAAKVHTDLLRHFGGAIINNTKTVSATYELHNGDIVKIIKTSKTLVPKKQWINKVITSDAKRELLKLLNIKNLKQRGFETLLDIANKNDVTIDTKVIKALLTKFSVPAKDELYSKIATGEIDTNQLENILSKFKKSSFFGIRLKTASKYRELKNNFILATCCNPTPEDKIVAIEENGTYYIHKINCNHIGTLFNNGESKKIIPIEWQKFKAQTLVKHISILARYRIDYMMQLTKVLYSIPKVEIYKIEFQKDENNNYKGSLDLLVLSEKDLNSLIKKIKDIPGTVSVDIV